MTQEELDALMNSDVDEPELGDETENESSDADVSEDSVDDIVDDVLDSMPDEISEDEPYNETDPEKYRVSALHNWPPPPPTDDNKMVHQLDGVTKESEEKASAIFDLIENVSNNLMDAEGTIQEVSDTLKMNVELFTQLTEKFPAIESFKESLANNKNALEKSDNMIEVAQLGGDDIINVMDIMQYQDIHRQKIERVINVMRALSGYMNTLFAGKIDDDKRVSSAVHLPGDDREDLVDSEDIEALLASFGQK